MRGEIETKRAKPRVVRRGGRVGGEVARCLHSEGVGGAAFGEGGGASRGRNRGAKKGRGIDARRAASRGRAGGAGEAEGCGRSGTLQGRVDRSDGGEEGGEEVGDGGGEEGEGGVEGGGQGEGGAREVGEAGEEGGDGEMARRERFVVSEMKRIRGEEEREMEAARRREEEEYWREMGERRRREEESRTVALREREWTRRRIADALIDTEDRKREREALLAELITEDVKLELWTREEEEEVERGRRKEELAADLKEQIVFTERCKLRFVERDREFAEGIMRRIKEDEKIGRLSAEARRRAQLRYRDELNRLIEIRRKIREEEIRRTKRDLEEEEEREKARSDRDKEERKRLLEKHAPNVANFIDKIPLSEQERETIERMRTNAQDPCQ